MPRARKSVRTNQKEVKAKHTRRRDAGQVFSLVSLAPEFERSSKSAALFTSDAIVAFKDAMTNFDAENVAGLAVGAHKGIGLNKGFQNHNR